MKTHGIAIFLLILSVILIIFATWKINNNYTVGDADFAKQIAQVTAKATTESLAGGFNKIQCNYGYAFAEARTQIMLLQEEGYQFQMDNKTFTAKVVSVK